MFVKLPYAFHVTGRKAKSRKMDRVIACDTRQLRLAETDAASAPVCVAWDETHPYNFFAQHAVGETGSRRVEVRYFGDRFYRPVTEPDGRHVEAGVLGARILVDYSPLGDLPHNMEAAQQAFSRGEPGYGRPDFEGETYGDEAEVVKALEDRAASLLVIDGLVWERCPEPVLIAEEEYRRETDFTVSPGFLDTHERSSQGIFVTFALDETDEAVEFLRGYQQAMGVDAEIRVSARVDAGISRELLGRSHVGDDAIRLAALSLRIGGGNTLNSVPSSYSRRWVALDKALEAARLTPDETNIQLLLEAWDGFTAEQERCFREGLMVAAQARQPETVLRLLHLSRSLPGRFNDSLLDSNAIFRGAPAP